MTGNTKYIQGLKIIFMWNLCGFLMILLIYISIVFTL